MNPVCFKVVQSPSPESDLLLDCNTEHSVPVPLQHPIYIARWSEGLFSLAIGTVLETSSTVHFINMDLEVPKTDEMFNNIYCANIIYSVTTLNVFYMSYLLTKLSAVGCYKKECQINISCFIDWGYISIKQTKNKILSGAKNCVEKISTFQNPLVRKCVFR